MNFSVTVVNTNVLQQGNTWSLAQKKYSQLVTDETSASMEEHKVGISSTYFFPFFSLLLLLNLL